MKKFISLAMIALLIVSLYACSQRDLADMTTGEGDGYATIIWGDKTYVPYGALSAYGDRG